MWARADADHRILLLHVMQPDCEPKHHLRTADSHGRYNSGRVQLPLCAVFVLVHQQ